MAGCLGVTSPLLLPYPPLLPLPGRSLIILVWPDRQKSPLAAPGTQFCNSPWLHLSYSRKTGDPSDTCFLLFFLQQQQQQTPNMIRIVPPTTDIAMIRASKFTKGFDRTHLAHKYVAACSYSIYKHTATVTNSFSCWLKTCVAAWESKIDIVICRYSKCWHQHIHTNRA